MNLKFLFSKKSLKRFVSVELRISIFIDAFQSLLSCCLQSFPCLRFLLAHSFTRWWLEFFIFHFIYHPRKMFLSCVWLKRFKENFIKEPFSQQQKINKIQITAHCIIDDICIFCANFILINKHSTTIKFSCFFVQF